MWAESFCKHLEQYNVTKLESTMQVFMKEIAATLSRPDGIQIWVTLKASFRTIHGKRAEGHSCQSADLAFGKEAATMLKDKELKSDSGRLIQSPKGHIFSWY